ncbi:MAG: M3 family oligoendopeptidase [Chloroflexia bacterium]|nr:M3 family oligoendopeptidase [Chloroflexia bacterium]
MTTSETTTAASLPRWDMTPVYPGLASVEFREGFARLLTGIDSLAELYDELGIGTDKIVLDLDDGKSLETVLVRTNALLDDLTTMRAYVAAFVSTDARDTVAQARESELRQCGVTIRQLASRLAAWVAHGDMDEMLAGSAAAREHPFPLAMMMIDAAHQMSREEEDLAADLSPSGGGAWAKLHGDLTSRMVVPFAVVEGAGPIGLPMSELRNLAHHADRSVRRRAYEAELEAWEDHAVPLAAAMNGIKGEGNVLSSRRGWETPLAAALHENRIDQATLDAMMGAAERAFPALRRYFQVKASALGIERLAWYDLFAPLPPMVGTEAPEPWTWERGSAFVVDRFGSFSPGMRGLAERALAEGWIDVEPRAGKRGGAFCMALRADESRILLNYTPSYGGVSTLAHELGHAYHNLNENGLTPLQRQTPMTLAETASTFCEAIVRDAALRDAGPAERREIIEGSLQDATQVIIDITSRFLFEGRVFAARCDRELSVAELCDLMLASQRETYGDGLDGAALHPYMWAVKPHYYGGRSFYNFPYMFGLLFGTGLIARAGDDPEAFASKYDDLLASTGRADAATLGERFGIDVRSGDFWDGSIAVILAGIDAFAETVAGDSEDDDRVD